MGKEYSYAYFGQRAGSPVNFCYGYAILDGTCGHSWNVGSADSKIQRDHEFFHRRDENYGGWDLPFCAYANSKNLPGKAHGLGYLVFGSTTLQPIYVANTWNATRIMPGNLQQVSVSLIYERGYRARLGYSNNTYEWTGPASSGKRPLMVTYDQWEVGYDPLGPSWDNGSWTKRSVEDIISWLYANGRHRHWTEKRSVAYTDADRFYLTGGNYPQRFKPDARQNDLVYGEEELWEGVESTRLALIHNKGWCTAHADMVENMPQASANQVANVLDALDAIRNIYGLLKGRTSFIKSLRSMNVGDVWLKKRYAVDTTVSDIEDCRSIYDRLQNLSQLVNKSCITLHGTARRGACLYRVSADYPLAQIIPGNIRDALHTYGMRGGLYNAWDMVPYSFIVDWFLPIGDWLDRNEKYAASFELDATNYWRSLETRSKGGQTCYLRLAGPPIFSVGPSLSLSETSSATILKRIADATAIFIL